MGVYERMLPKMATWAPMDTSKTLSAQRLWMVLCLAMASTFSVDARIISGRGYSDTIVFSSTAGAAEYQGTSLGEFVRVGDYNGRPFYKQRDTEGSENTFLFSEGGIRVVGSGSVLIAQWNQMGIYRLQEGRWSSGRPVYKKGSGSTTRFLHVKEGKCLWSIDDSTSSEMAYIQSGRATNSPTSSRAGGSVRYGRTNWTYVNRGRWNEGEISVTCF